MDVKIMYKSDIKINDYISLNKLLHNLIILIKQQTDINEENKDITSVMNVILTCLIVNNYN
jgi:hypothetical protein